MQSVAPAFEKLPGEHGVQAVPSPPPSGRNVPVALGGQWSVVWRLTGIGRGAGVLCGRRSLQRNPPAGHGWQGAPVAGEKCPPGHSWQVDWSAVGWVPAAHSVQDV